MWGREQWQEAVMGADYLVTTLQLFLDALEAHHVDLSTFCVMVGDECQHCSGSHPFATIFPKHYIREGVKGQLRVLGVSAQLVKSKTK